MKQKPIKLRMDAATYIYGWAAAATMPMRNVPHGCVQTCSKSKFDTFEEEGSALFFLRGLNLLLKRFIPLL